MKFRKDLLLFYQSNIAYIIALILLLILIPPMPGILLALPFLILLLVNPKLHSEYITIDETGISCSGTKGVLWAYPWESIASLKKGSRFLLPSIEIISFDKHGAPERFAAPGHYFQLSKPARHALLRYYSASQNERS